MEYYTLLNDALKYFPNSTTAAEGLTQTFHLYKYKNSYFFLNSKERNIIEAASTGASQSIKLVANIAVNLIAAISLLHFINSTLIWLGYRVGLRLPEHEELTFEARRNFLLVINKLSYFIVLDFCISN